MKRPIKFRGRIAKDHVENWKHGEIICGSLMVFADDPIAGCTHWIIDEKSKPYRNYPVDEDSIAQFVGYDKDGREIYEGDIVEYTSSRPRDRASQRTKTAPIGLCPQIYADDTDHNKPMRRFKLKEA